jgi:hypothetical protein
MNLYYVPFDMLQTIVDCNLIVGLILAVKRWAYDILLEHTVGKVKMKIQRIDSIFKRKAVDYEI